MVEDIERETRERLENESRTVLGSNLVRQTHPHHRPRKIKRSPAPSCRCSESSTWKEFRDGFRWFVSVYRAAARRLKRGDQAVRFPENCFPPALAFTGIGASPPSTTPT